MSDMTSLTAQPLSPGSRFNWIFLVELLVCGIVTIFFLFYFNRLFATLVSYGFRAYTWHKYRVYVDVQALQISLLGGRIFFKGVRYHGENETVLIQNGYITWNYWLRAVRQADCARFADDEGQSSVGSARGLKEPSQSAGIERSAKESGAVKAAQDLPCRLSVCVSGFEWFIYNRSPAYEAIAASHAAASRKDVNHQISEALQEGVDLNAKHKDVSGPGAVRVAEREQSSTRLSANSMSSNCVLPASEQLTSLPDEMAQRDGLKKSTTLPPLDVRSKYSSAQGSGQEASPTTSPLILTLLPIFIECQKGAIVIGNEHTRTVLTTSFEKSRGHIDAAKSGPEDIYRQIFEFDVTHPIVRLKPNPDYRQSQQGAAETFIHNANAVHARTSWWDFNWRFDQRKRKVRHSLRNLMPYFRSSVESFRPSSPDGKNEKGEGNWPNEIPGESRWLGLSRYLDEDDHDDHEGWSNVEYARFSNIVDCPSVHLSLYWDVPGKVQEDALNRRPDLDQNINLGEPPSYALDVILRGGNVNYGPWADRARAEIQNMLFPNSYQIGVPAAPLAIGALRQSTKLNINLHIENEITLRIPSKENSKDWQWKGRAGALRGASGIKNPRDKKHTRKKKADQSLLGPDVRPFGWFAVSVSPSSTITYNMDMVAGTQGYRNDLELDLKGTRMTTSVNHDLLWRCGPQKIFCDLSNPLIWNSSHTWTFKVQSHGMELFLLRDHVFLLSDLISDFTSGPQNSYLIFVPFLYKLNLSFTDVKLYLNANDSNIIDNPCDVDDNTFLILHGESLEVNLDIPLEHYAPSASKIDFNAKAKDARLDLAMPVWNTIHTFASDLPTATLEDFSMDGWYNFHSSTSPNLTDSLYLNLNGFSPRIFLQGFLIRYCMKLKDNYFGDDIHFRTLQEYQQFLSKQKDEKAELLQPHNKKENDLDVILQIKFDSVCVLLPANIYSRKENLRLDFLLIETDVRITNYYMDLEAKFSPIEAAWESVKAEGDKIHDYVSKTEAFVDGITIYGHRLFGSPPSEPTYVCNWDFDVGMISGECSNDFIRILSQAVQSFAFTFEDVENVLPQPHVPVLNDITFLRASLSSIKLWVPLDDTAIFFGVGQIEIGFNDWAGKSLSDRFHVGIPSIQLAAVDKQSALRNRDLREFIVPTHAIFQLSVEMNMAERKLNFNEQRRLQQQHVKVHDQRTNRTSWLLHNTSEMNQPDRRLRRVTSNQPAMPVPHMPDPLSNESLASFPQLTSHVKKQLPTSTSRLRSRRSFLSPDSSRHSSSFRSTSSSPSSSAQSPNRRRHYSLSPSVSYNVIAHRDGSTKIPSAGHSGEHFLSGKRLPPDAKLAVTCSSPWTAPYFQLEKIIPDTRNLPNEPRSVSLTRKSKHQRADSQATLDYVDNNNKTTHTMYDIDLGSSVRGFASPKFFSAISALVKALRPVEPTDLLDALQMSAMSKVHYASAIPLELRQTTDICVRLPFAHLKVEHSSSQMDLLSDDAYRDHYDFRLVGLKVTTRSSFKEKRASNDSRIEKDMRIHAAIKKTLLEVHDRSSDLFYDEAAIRVLLGDIALWIVSDNRTTVRMQQRDLEAASWGSQTEYLVSLFHRTVDLSNFVANQFANIDSAAHFQSLIYCLTDAAGGLTDPVFLTRPSYVLRAADNHVRLDDSWKIASRLRHMLQSLDSDQRATLVHKYSRSIASLPSNAEAIVLDSFDNWRSWDLAHVRKSLIMEIIWGPIGLVEDAQPHKGSLTLELALERAKFLLDPGPKENGISIHDISTTISKATEVSPAPNETFADIVRSQIVIVQICCSRSEVHLNWELVELVFDTTALLSPRPEKAEQSSLSAQKEVRSPDAEQTLQIVFAIDSVVLEFDSINFHGAMAVSDFRGSLFHRVDLKGGETMAMLLAAKTASARVKHKERLVLGWLLDNSAVSLSQASRVLGGSDPAIVKAMGKCETLRFEMREDLSSSLEIATRIMRDEVNGITSRLGTSSEAVQQKGSSSLVQQRSIYMALFLDQYTLSIAVFPSLTYVISGEVTRTSVVPISPSVMAVNFDLKRHRHAFRLKSNDRSNQLATLEIPPFNSRVILTPSTESTKINVDATLDKVELDAKSVRSFIDTLNQPEVVRALINAKKNFQQASSQMSTISPTRSSAVAKSPDRSVGLLYSANVTFIGLSVRASAPALKSKDYRADLDFVLGLTTVRFWNQGMNEHVAHMIPQFDVSFRSVSLNIYRHSHESTTQFGKIDFNGRVTGETETDEQENQIQKYHAAIDSFEVDLRTETASLVVDIAVYLQERIKSFALTDEVKRLKSLRRLTIAGLTESPTITVTGDKDNDNEEEEDAKDTTSSSLFDSVYSLELDGIKIAWRLNAGISTSPSREVEDLVFSIQNVKLNTKREGSATLAITDLQLQMVPKSMEVQQRSWNSALMPEIIFKAAYLSTRKDRRLAFQAAGKALDLRLASDFIIPLTALRSSLIAAVADLREGNALWAAQPAASKKEKSSLFGSKYLASLLIDVDFAGAVVNIQTRRSAEERKSVFGILKGDKRSRAGRYGQVVEGDGGTQATLRAPGVAMKIEYVDNRRDDPALTAEVKVAASSNVLYPSVVPLIIEVSSSVKDIAGNTDESVRKPISRRKSEISKPLTSSGLSSSNPSNLMGRCKLNLGVWIREQEFSLSCQPIARVAATARFNDIFMAVKTVQSADQERFFALSVTFNGLRASVQHVYSRESTASLEVESVVLSMMNSKHVSNTTGVSAILNISPMKSTVNAKQLQDFLLFREIWYPAELRQSPSSQTAASVTADHQAVVVQRYQQVAGAGAFPWNAVVSVQELVVQLDLGQSLGKSIFTISKLWASSRKASDFEQNLCFGFEQIRVKSTGRMSGFIELQNFRLRTSIRWPKTDIDQEQTPWVQASLGLDQFRVKADFDYQPFAIAEISKFDFLMYNIRPNQIGEKDRLVGNLEGEKVQIFFTTASASQALSLYQAVIRLIQERDVAYEASLRELDRYLRRKSLFPSSSWTAASVELGEENKEKGIAQGPFSLHTDVVVTLRAVNVGAFPSTFFDTQIFKVEATDAQARFSVSAIDGKTQSGLGLTLGQLRVALATVNRVNTQALGEVSVDDVVSRATSSRGGTILKVPKVVASMQTWQKASSNSIDYIFKSIFEGKVDVGWNYSRISFIRGMWSAHSRALAARLGKPLPQSAVQITGGPQPDGDEGQGTGQDKITAVVNVPQSRFEYRALEPPIIDTPQLRDMGEATPPLEWIGLHRDKLPNVTHQIIIVTLLGVAKEVEEAYSKILGSS